MAKTYEYVSERRLLYFTQKLKDKFPKASDFIDDTTAALDKIYSSQKVEDLLAAIIDDTAGAGDTTVTWSADKITDMFSKVAGIEFKKVATLPTTDQQSNAIYLVPIRMATATTSIAGTDALVDKNKFLTQETANGTYTYTFNGSDWEDATNTVVNLADYGISFSGTYAPVASDTVSVVLAEGTNPNVFEEYIWIADDSKYELIGTTEADLSGYVKDEDMIEITTAEIDNIINTVWPPVTPPVSGS